MQPKTICSTLALALISLAGAACTSTPGYAYNGLVRIEYPRPGGSAMLMQICDATAQRLKAAVMAEGKRKGIPVRWVEVYRARAWGSTFHDLIYKTRTFGYDQTDFRKYTAYTGPSGQNAETVVYANRAGKYIALYSRDLSSSSNRTSDFIVYGN